MAKQRSKTSWSFCLFWTLLTTLLLQTQHVQSQYSGFPYYGGGLGGATAGTGYGGGLYGTGYGYGYGYPQYYSYPGYGYNYPSYGYGGGYGFPSYGYPGYSYGYPYSGSGMSKYIATAA